MPKDTFGGRLKSEREDRGLSIQAVAEILHVDHDRLRALEHDDFLALPDEAVMMDCLHEYAACLEVDADLMIKDYLQERDKFLQPPEDIVVEQAAETAAATIPTEAERRPRFPPWLVALVVVAIAILAAWWLLSRDRTAPTPEAPPDAPPGAPMTPVVTAPVEPQPFSSTTPADVAQTPPAGVAQTPIETPAARSAPAAPAPPVLRITEYGVGAAVENLQLVGRSDRFNEGARVFFWTRVRGGAPGDRIDHVWIREGAVVMRISLEVGGSSWRTYSTKTLSAVGDWAVEARDDAGRVLARSEFVCGP